MKHREETRTQKAWPQAEFSRLAGTLLTALFGIFTYSLIQLIRLGGDGNHYVFMLIGCVLSAVGVFSYTIASYIYGAANRKSFIAMILTFLGFIPYLYGCYIVFYQGFWGFTELRFGFSIWVVVKAIGAIILGFIVVNKMYEITELDKKVSRMAKQEHQ